MQWIIALDFPILSECSSLSNELDRKRIDRLGLVRARIFTRRVRRFYRKFEIVTIHLIFANVRNTRTLKLYVLTLSDWNKFLVRFHFFDYRRKATNIVSAVLRDIRSKRSLRILNFAWQLSDWGFCHYIYNLLYLFNLYIYIKFVVDFSLTLTVSNFIIPKISSILYNRSSDLPEGFTLLHICISTIDSVKSWKIENPKLPIFSRDLIYSQNDCR